MCYFVIIAFSVSFIFLKKMDFNMALSLCSDFPPIEEVNDDITDFIVVIRSNRDRDIPFDVTGNMYVIVLSTVIH